MREKIPSWLKVAALVITALAALKTLDFVLPWVSAAAAAVAKHDVAEAAHAQHFKAADDKCETRHNEILEIIRINQQEIILRLEKR